jgi:hypothetical protein
MASSRGILAALCAATLGTMALAAPCRAVAQAGPAQCRGVDPGAAASAIAAGDEAVERAASLASRGRAAAARSAFEAALSSYDAACSAGADLALERRAIPLARLGRALDAIQSLDAFLAAHPLESLPPDDRARIESNRRSVERQVTTLSIAAQPPATASIDGREIGSTPITAYRLAAGGSVRVVLRAPGHQDWTQEVSLEPGTTQRLSVELVQLPAAEPTPPLVSVPSPTEVADPTERTPARDTDTTVASGPGAEEPVHGGGGSDRVPWIVVSGVVAAIGLGVGVGGVVLASDRRAALEGACFTVAAPLVPGCPSIVAEHDLGVGLAVGGFALAALAGTAAVVLAVLPEEHGGGGASLTCSVGLGISCRASF